MATQGVVSIVRDRKVQFKAVAGCDGMAATDLANLIRESPPKTLAELAKLCRDAGFGCEDCLVVQSETAAVIATGERLGKIYFEKFSEPRFNPRWVHGTADYVEVVEL